MTMEDSIASISNHPTEATWVHIERAASILLDGGIVVFPTETVYGVGASSVNPVGTQHLRFLKGRTDGKPFTVHIGNPNQLFDYVANPTQAVRRLTRKAFPGPLTLLLPEPHPEKTRIAEQYGNTILPELYSDGWVGLRCPDHAACRDILTTVESPIVASSANFPGDPPPLTGTEAYEQIGDSVDLVLDAGPCPMSASSTIARITQMDTIEIVRKGFYDQQMIERMMAMHLLFVCTGNTCRSPMAEALCTHYIQRTGSDSDNAKSGYQVSSAGVMASAGYPASDGAIQAMRSRGINLENHRSKPLTNELANSADAIYCMTESHRQGVLSIAPEVEDKCYLLSDSDINDPIGGSIEIYQQCAKEIEAGINRIIQEESK